MRRGLTRWRRRLKHHEWAAIGHVLRCAQCGDTRDAKPGGVVELQGCPGPRNAPMATCTCAKCGEVTTDEMHAHVEW